ncbi:MAG: dicarboxylate/amino acid:cation symporter [Bacteroidales bacterium]|nr:dicarboxylate/amino acid:cation symporter [Bacteroidales bacterium]MDD4215806.1 dicarboxylate/amino acid:cation symporter [Bacteroidales bacterium]MDY0142776.1 dicarboxylate/amino acid:cation symporter [Bacteroidales bacterium]
MNLKLKKIPLSVKILIGMLLGVTFGLIAINTGLVKFTSDWISPFGTIFIKLLKLIAIPLILVSLIKGISDLKDRASLSKMGFSTIALYMLTTVIAISIGLSLAYLIKPGDYFPKDKQEVLFEKYSESILEGQNMVASSKDDSPIQFFVDIVPENIFFSATNNTMMLQVIFFSILFGLAIITLPRDKTKAVRKVVNSLNDIVLRIIEIIMKFAPIGVFALLAAVITDVAGENPADSLALFGALGMYALVVIVGLLLVGTVIYPIFAALFSKMSYFKFLKGIFPAQLLAFSTSSSAATLPVTKKCVDENLDVDDEVSSFVLPIGATINMDGTSLYQAVAAVFIAQVFGIDLSFNDMLTIVLTATLASIGSAAVPGAGMIMLLIVLASVNIPAEGLALIFAIDRPLDMLRTTVNVTGDSLISVIINKFVAKPKKV